MAIVGARHLGVEPADESRRQKLLEQFPAQRTRGVTDPPTGYWLD
jgi:hypothetical protein